MKARFVSIFVIIALGLAVYWNSLDGGFITDDHTLVKDNVYIKDWSNLPRLFTRDITQDAQKEYRYYRPLTSVTYMMDYFFWKLNVRGYHFTNILLHILVALSIYWLINILFRDNTLSLLTAVLFIAHPVHTDAVSYISGRADSLAALFMLLCFIFYAKHLDLKNKGMYILMLACYLLALLSKENSLILPALLLLYHYTFKKKIRVGLLMPILIAAGGYVVSRLVFFKSAPLDPSSANTVLQRIPGFFAAISSYARLLISPTDLHMDYGTRLFDFADPIVILGIVLVASLLLCAVKIGRNSRLIFLSILWFFLALLPMSNIYPLFSYMAEHFLYLPSMGFFLLLAAGLCRLANTKDFRGLAVVFTLSLLGFYSYLTVEQNEYWRDPAKLYRRTLKYNPYSGITMNNLGLLYQRDGRYEEAMELFEEAMEVAPSQNDITMNNLGLLYQRIGKYEEAIDFFKRAIETAPDQAETYSNLAGVYSETGRKTEAVELCEKAIGINPGYKKAYNNLGSLYYEMGRKEEAIRLYNKAIAIDPSYAKAYSDLGAVYYDMGEKEKAIKLYRKAIELEPEQAKVYTNLADMYCERDNRDEVIELYKKAIAIDPNHTETYNNLGAAYYDMGEKEKAIRYYKKAIEIDPNCTRAYNNLGIAYYNMGRIEEAVGLCKKAIEIDPYYTETYNNLGAAYYDMGEKEEATELFRRAIEIDPNYAKAYNNLAAIYCETGRRAEAIELYKKAIEINPNYKEAYIALAATYYDMGEEEEAKKLYKKLREIYPDAF